MTKYTLTRRGALAGIGGLVVGGAVRIRPAKAATTLRMWTFLDPVNGKSTREMVLKKIIDSFQEANPGVTVQVELQNWQTMAEKFFAAHQSGNAPDLPWVLMSRVRGAVKLGSLANLHDYYMKDWKKADFDDLDGPTFRLGASDKAHYTVPNSMGMQTQLYRVDLFKEAGLDATSVSTWDKFFQNVPKLVKKDGSGAVTQWGFVQPNAGLTPLTPVAISVMLDRDGAIFDDQNRAKWATPAGVQGLQIQSDMIRKYQVMPPTQVNMGNEETIEQFHAGRAAIGRISTARWPIAVQRFGAGNIRVLHTPGVKEGKYAPTEVTGWHLGVWQGSKEKELAAKFVDHFGSKKADAMFAMEAGLVPIRRSTVTENKAFFDDPKNAILSDISDGIKNLGWIAPEGAGDSGWNEGLVAAFQDVMTNNTDPKAALEKAEAAFNRQRRT